MTLPLFCIVLAYAVVYGTKIPVAIAMGREGKGYDNRTPREQQARLEGWGKRAVAAQSNGFEVTPYFAACVLVGHVSGGNPKLCAGLAATFVVSRVVYVATYIADLASVRSVVWAFGMIASAAIALSSFCNG